MFHFKIRPSVEQQNPFLNNPWVVILLNCMTTAAPPASNYKSMQASQSPLSGFVEEHVPGRPSVRGPESSAQVGDLLTSSSSSYSSSSRTCIHGIQITIAGERSTQFFLLLFLLLLTHLHTRHSNHDMHLNHSSRWVIYTAC